ncbi:hypothetical protein cyc_08606 [Cyclospora cayetanensis]|uniref:Uncharacterized protein n=1 Tax=Cyclospora cayetanensis TaxID=88456 RepID=A0A1D3CZH6_9EIME|nr:hypothetical protein cyc_08606 [Cyclospora cayetanensis]
MHAPRGSPPAAQRRVGEEELQQQQLLSRLLTVQPPKQPQPRRLRPLLPEASLLVRSGSSSWLLDSHCTVQISSHMQKSC